MVLLDSIAKRLGYTKAQVSNAPGWLRADAESAKWSMPDRSLPEAQLELYQRLVWVQIAVGTVAETAATTEFEVSQIVGEEEEEIDNHPFELLLRRPNPLESRFEFLVSTFSHLALTGNCYWWLNRSNEKATPDELWVIPSYKIKPIPDGKLFLRGYLYEPDVGVEIPLETWEVVHFRKWHPLNMFVGLSPIESLATDAEGELAMQKWNTNLFSKDNAKVPGALAFADPINDTDWRRMKDDIKREHGGTNRSLMMLRNVGKGGVEWVQMAMSQSDMQFLEARTFTKEEIFALYAPGLSPVLAVNSTEANSIAGDATFTKRGVWPRLVQVAEKITNDILPAYGENLRGEFEDIRPSDKLLELQEQQAAERVHTVDEIRAKFYNDKPIGDERGNLTVTELQRYTAPSSAPAMPAMPQSGSNGSSEPLQPRNQAQQQQQQDAQSNGGQPNGQQPQAAQQAQQPAKAQNVEARKAEVKAFKAWLKKRPNADIHDFKTEHLTHEDLHEIAEEVRGVATEQPFFTLPESFTHDSVKALKAMILQLDPNGNDENAELRIREELERKTTRAIDKAFTDMVNTLFPQGYGSAGAFIDPNLEADRIHRRFVEDQALKDALSRALQDSVDLGVSVAVSQFDAIGFGFDWTLANTAARRWALNYTDDLLTQMGTTTRKGVGVVLDRWIGNGENLDSLISDLEPIFGKKRANLVAVTEVTRAFFEGNTVAYKESGVVSKVMWRTVRDEIVSKCPICAPMEGMTTELGKPWIHPNGKEVTIPGHVLCRCWSVPVIS